MELRHTKRRIEKSGELPVIEESGASLRSSQANDSQPAASQESPASPDTTSSVASSPAATPESVSPSTPAAAKPAAAARKTRQRGVTQADLVAEASKAGCQASAAAKLLLQSTFKDPAHKQLAIIVWRIAIDMVRAEKRKRVMDRDVKLILSLLEVVRQMCSKELAPVS